MGKIFHLMGKKFTRLESYHICYLKAWEEEEFSEERMVHSFKPYKRWRNKLLAIKLK